ncbi:hypothetical protein pb186bvf_005133 [Paramecium bursaria]
MHLNPGQYLNCLKSNLKTFFSSAEIYNGTRNDLFEIYNLFVYQTCDIKQYNVSFVVVLNQQLLIKIILQFNQYPDNKFSIHFISILFCTLYTQQYVVRKQIYKLLIRYIMIWKDFQKLQKLKQSDVKIYREF